MNKYVASRIKTARVLSEKWDSHANMKIKKHRLMGTSSPVAQPVEGKHTIQGQQSRQTLTDQTSSNISSTFCFFYSFFAFVLWSKVRTASLWVEQHKPLGGFVAVWETLWFPSRRQRGQRETGCRTEQCHYRLLLNQGSIRFHRLQERCSETEERGVHYKHPQDSTNCRNSLKAKMVRLKDNLGELSEHRYSGRKLSNYSKQRKRSIQQSKSTFVLMKVWDWLHVITESNVCSVFKQKRRQFNVTTMSWFRLLSISKFWTG